jgi:hypothetical protein
MNHQERYLSYLLRVWEEGGGSPGGDTPDEPPLWRASLESPHSHEVRSFAGLDELFAFLREQVDMEPPQSGAAADGRYNQRGGSEMNRTLVLVVVIAAVVVAAVAVGAVLLPSGDTEPMAVEGSWAWEITSDSVTSAGDKVFSNGTSAGTWGGLFEGTSTGQWRSRSGPTGPRQWEETITFEGSVEDETGKQHHGTLEILYVGEAPDRESGTEGTWEIIAGEGELERCHGHGTFKASPRKSDPEIDYTGQIYFEPQPFWRFW